jgi:hypothetical protein
VVGDRGTGRFDGMNTGVFVLSRGHFQMDGDYQKSLRSFSMMATEQPIQVRVSLEQVSLQKSYQNTCWELV